MQSFESDILAKARAALESDAAGCRLLLAVSGGVDSVAMLDIICRLAPEMDCEVVVGHVDHSLRPESRTDAEFVADLANRLRLPMLYRKVDVLSLAQDEKLSREAAARKLRYQALEKMAEDGGCQWILTAHTADDSAETFLMRFIQSPDWWEWTSIPQKRGKIRRPLINVRREHVKRYTLDRKLAWRDDVSNEDLRFMRNYLRLKALPKLVKQGGGVDIAVLAAAGGMIREIVERLLNEADEFIQEEAKAGHGSKMLLAIPDIFCYFNIMPWAPVERAAVQLIGNPDLRWPAWRRRQIANFIAGSAPKGMLKIGESIFLLRNGTRLSVARNLPKKMCYYVRGLGCFEFNNTGNLKLSIKPNIGVLDKGNRIHARTTLVNQPLQLRTWQPGDKLDIFQRGRRKVSSLLSELHIDPAGRMEALVLCDEEGPFWLVDHWSDQRVRPLSEDKHVLELEWKATQLPS